jgi:RHS repeat-associated protein
VTTETPAGRTLQALHYTYDLVGNVVGLVNSIGPAATEKSGAVKLTYSYDELYRLKEAVGEAAARPQVLDRFRTSFTFDDAHNMKSNMQVHEILHAGANPETPPKTNHAWTYEYQGAGPHQATRIGDRFLIYDANGSVLRECSAQQGDPSCSAAANHLRTYAWTEENRLDAVVDGGGRNVTRFFYDAGGNRLAKLGRGGEAITIGQFFAVKGRRAATKHVFAGGSRIATKLLPPPGWDDGAILAAAAATFDTAGASNESGCDPSDYKPQKCPVLPGGDPVLNHRFDGARVKPATYYYHPDHVGTIAWITDQNARVHEHVEYFPYGEVWRDVRADSDGAPVKGQRFLFTGKQLDEETGLYYFGARYLNPGTARWLSCDPADRHTPGQSSIGLNPYEYAYFSPAVVTDPTGAREPYDFEARYIAQLRQWALEERTYPSWFYRVTLGDGKSAALDRMAGELAYAIHRAWDGEPVVAYHFMNIEPLPVDVGNENRQVDIRLSYAPISDRAPSLRNHPWQPATIPGGAPSVPAPGQIWDVLPYAAQQRPRPENTEAHHGVKDAWSQARYGPSARNEAPTILMPNEPNHNATRLVYPRWAVEIARRQGVRTQEIDWLKVSPGEIWRLAEEELEAAEVPESVREEFFRQWNEFRREKEGEREGEALPPRVEPAP